jgi:hypothetical protein
MCGLLPVSLAGLLFPELTRMKNLASLALGLLLCNSAFASEFDFSFNSDAFRAIYIHDFRNHDLQSDFGLLYTDDDGYVANVSLYLSGFASDGSSPLQVGIGGRTGIVDGDKSGQTGAPIAVGGYLKYTFPNLNRVSIRGDAWFAPEILSLGDLEKYQDYSLRLGYNVMKEADIYIGLRYVKGNFDNGTKVDFDDGANIGFSIRF